ncbi:hypothetical protein MFLAVUS_011393 [Mucor flavus]|uniref:Uncharacterized protein n=1 Tax=Mucor flavus TaxID=439312 RepID=A0ABP9ZFE7_9FUNG
MYYDEDWDELCNVCINRLDNNFILNEELDELYEELDELYEESKSTLSSDIEMEEEVYDESSSETKLYKHYGGLVVLKSTLCPIQENVFTVSLPETEEFSVESAPVESAPVVRLVRRKANN